jgi:xylan 1,4-beta-xylosidase
MIKKLLILTLLITSYQISKAQNPIIPGYYADPSVKKFGNTYYLYVTTDGYPPYGSEGQTFVWTSTNLTDWKPEVLQGLPNKTIWAPAIIKGKNDKFYLYTTNAIDYSGYVWEGDSPTGPFTLKNHIGGFDLEPFADPVSGKIYVVSASKILMEMDNDVGSPTYLTKVIHNISLKGSFYGFTEGPYMDYKNGWYYLMWSGGNCSDKSYNVRYAYSKNLEGPYIDGKESIIKTDETKDIMGPGHNSVIDIDGRSFLFYHREDSSRPLSCNYRFTCVSEISFNANGEVKLLSPIDELGKLLGHQHQYIDLALNKDVITNSSVGDYDAEKAVDGRNDTRWTSKSVPAFLTVDLAIVQKAEGVEIDFEFMDKIQTFKVEYSTDNINWTILDDHSDEAITAFKARVIMRPFKARYVRLSFTNSEDRTGSVWEFKVLGK